MAAIGTAAQAWMLNWLLTSSSAPTRPTAWALGLATGAPSSVSGSEISTGSGYTRSNITFNSAAAGVGTVSNTIALTYGPFSNAQSISGAVVYDTLLSLGSGNILFFGNLATARTVGVGDQLVVAIANAICTLA
jgi:hypothetical protein